MIRSILLFSLISITLTGCSTKGVDRCYVDIQEYDRLKAVFLETGSMQRVEQVMEDEQWASCEREQVRYQLAKNLYLDELAGQ